MNKYYNYKRFETLAADTNSLATECNGITFDNRGEVAVILYAEGTPLEILPGETISHNNHPGVLEITFYDKVIFANTPGIKKLFITREFVVERRPDDIYQSPKER